MSNILDDYFMTSHSGRAIEAFSIRTEDRWTMDFFSCTVCFALTVEPVLHAEWHEEVLNGSQS